MGLFCALVLAAAQLRAAVLPRVNVGLDDTTIAESCVIQIAPGIVISDANENGVIQVGADNITIQFGLNTTLRGATQDTPGDKLRGVGININGRTNVTIIDARVHGFKNGLLATRADGLVVSDGDFSDNYRQRLKSTRAGEANEDWLFPHHNDQRKWRDEFGGAVCVENSANITIRRIKVRRGQNGILLDRVTDSAIYDNDCSFLSGWGIALWMSSRNNIQHNAFDFCIRGHFEGAYNRGQDSAGILVFEQCNENIFAENSATHGGDGFFGFAGHAAIGETWWNEERARLRKVTGKTDVDAQIKPPSELVNALSPRGCNGNLLIGNDFSYASAHGIELTFSENNKIIRNRIVANGITGFWGGYSSGTVIAENEFRENGDLGYGLERGGINMEHAAENLIVRNKFVNNKCAVHLWWDNDGALMRYPGVAGNERGVIGNIIAGNHFEVNLDADFKRTRPSTRFVIVHLRDASQGNLSKNAYFKNDLELKHPLAQEFALENNTQFDIRAGKMPSYETPKYARLGSRRPVGARRAFNDRRYIQLDEWGPKELTP